MDLMHLMRPTPTQKWRKCLEKESFVPRPCTDVSHQQHAARGLPSPVCTQKGRHCLSGAWSHPFPEFGHNHRHLICNICPCSVVMQHSPNSHGTFFFFFCNKSLWCLRESTMFSQNTLPCNCCLGYLWESQPRICRVLSNDQGGFNPLT